MHAEEASLIYEGGISALWCYLTDLFDLINFCKRCFLLQLRPLFEAQLGLLPSDVLQN